MKILYSVVLGLSLVACQKSEAKPMEQKQEQVLKTRTEFRYEIAEIAETARPFVVSITTEKAVDVNMMNPFEQFFGPQFRGNQNSKKQYQKGLGSGVIVSEKGYVLTNNHVVEGADEIQVNLFDERTFKAKIVGLDEKTDLAVIQLEGDLKDLPIARLGDSEVLRVGEWVVAIGSPFGLNHTVTTGIVSAKNVHGRGITSYENFIQTDAAINPGNSGGALLNLDGELIGINTAILSRSGGFQGIGFAIPVNMAKDVMGDLIDHGKVNRGWLGVSIQDLDKELAQGLGLTNEDGVLVSQVLEGTPAAEAELKEGDVILKVKGEPVRNVNELRNKIASIEPGSKVEFVLVRSGKTLKKTVELGAMDGEAKLQKSKDTDIEKLGLKVGILTDELRKKMGFSDQLEGLLVLDVEERSAAAKAGIAKGSVLLKANNVILKSIQDLKKELEGERVLLWVHFGDARRFVVVNLK